MAMSNYKSAELSRSALGKIVYKDVARGFIPPTVPRPEVIAKFGERVAICAVGAVPKDDGPDGDHRDLQPDGIVAGDQVRVILDGSVGVQVNHRLTPVKPWRWRGSPEPKPEQAPPPSWPRAPSRGDIDQRRIGAGAGIGSAGGPCGTLPALGCVCVFPLPG